MGEAVLKVSRHLAYVLTMWCSDSRRRAGGARIDTIGEHVAATGPSNVNTTSFTEASCLWNAMRMAGQR